MKKIYDKINKVWIPVSDDVFEEYRNDTNVYCRKNQRHGNCKCPRSKRWLCDLDCPMCEFYICDESLRRGTQPSNTSITGKHHYWRCSKRDGCDTVGLREDFLKPLLADVLGIAEFDDNVFKEQIDHIDVLSATDLTIYFKDGRKISRIWESKTKRGESSGKNSNDNTRYDK